MCDLGWSRSIQGFTEELQGIIQLPTSEETKMNQLVMASGQTIISRGKKERKETHLFASMNSLYSFFFLTPDIVLHIQHKRIGGNQGLPALYKLNLG